tara:strand:- start:1295 stop:1396 length:102 start_codon:yes stop_codon:yes gene_type:complete
MAKEKQEGATRKKGKDLVYDSTQKTSAIPLITI